MDFVSINVENTPNPHARKFVFDRPIAMNVLDVEGIKQVHFFGNCLTVSKSLVKTWDDVEPTLITLMKSMIPSHDPGFDLQNKPSKDHYTPEMIQMDEILDESIRPFLQADGGDLRLVGFESNILTVSYEGACEVITVPSEFTP